MSRAVLGMYQERKWALRFFWVGLMFTLSSGIALGWLKFHQHTAITMTTIFIMFIIIFVLYVKNVTRPRFAFDKVGRSWVMVGRSWVMVGRSWVMGDGGWGMGDGGLSLTLTPTLTLTLTPTLTLILTLGLEPLAERVHNRRI